MDNLPSARRSTTGLLFRRASLVLGVGAAAFAIVTATDTRAAVHKALMPLLHGLDPETSHRLSIAAAKWRLAPREWVSPDPHARLATNVLGLALDSPLGVAAGFDKHGEAVDALLAMGFGLVELGSVTPLPQDGNPKPRFFRLPQDNAVINRYGFNSDGHAAVAKRLALRLSSFLISNYPSTRGQLPPSIPFALVPQKALGINLGKNKLSLPDDNTDYVKGVSTLGQYADYIVVNISSPNTPGLRSLQRREPMLKLMNEVREARDQTVSHHPPILVKIAPDVSFEELQDIATVITEAKIDGVIISNTTISRPSDLKSDPQNVSQTGGLSGPPVFPLALQKVREFYALTNGKIPIIGCGGISNAEDALAFGKAGASLIQLYTALGYQGPSIVYDIKKGLVDTLEKEGKTWPDIVGADHRK